MAPGIYLSPQFSLRFRRKTLIVRDERLDPGGETYAKRTLLWGKVNLFTAAMSWEIECVCAGGGLQERFHPCTRQTNKST